MKYNIYLLLLVFAFLSGGKLATAQMDSCIVSLKNANTGYEQGDFDGAIKLLKNSLAKCQLGKDDKIQVHKLLILCYLSIDNLEEANKSVATIMKINPNYKPDKFKDDPKLTTLFEKYRPLPMMAIGIRGGINKSSIKTVQTYSVVHDDANNNGSYKRMVLFQFSGYVERRIHKKIWAEAGIQYRSTGYTHTLNDIMGTSVAYSEKLNYFDLPILCRYYLTESKSNKESQRTFYLTPYVHVGLCFSFLADALSTTTRDDQTDIAERTALRNRLFISPTYGFGFSTRINGFQYHLEAAPYYTKRLVNKKNTRYADPLNLYKYYYIDDDFRMNRWQFNFGASYFISYKNQKTK